MCPGFEKRRGAPFFAPFDQNGVFSHFVLTFHSVQTQESLLPLWKRGGDTRLWPDWLRFTYSTHMLARFSVASSSEDCSRNKLMALASKAYHYQFFIEAIIEGSVFPCRGLKSCWFRREVTDLSASCKCQSGRKMEKCTRKCQNRRKIPLILVYKV